MITLTLPYPPTVNHYYTVVRGRKILSKNGREYLARVVSYGVACGVKKIKGKVAVSIGAYLPDQRRRDLDNLLKPTLDALVAAGVIEDDSKIGRLSIEMVGFRPGGELVVTIDAL